MSSALNRRQFLDTAAFAGALGACAPAEEAPATDDRPNIILLMGDDHAWDEAAYNGHPHLKTPVMDEMAAQGLRIGCLWA